MRKNEVKINRNIGWKKNVTKMNLPWCASVEYCEKLHQWHDVTQTIDNKRGHVDMLMTKNVKSTSF